MPVTTHTRASSPGNRADAEEETHGERALEIEFEVE